MKSRQSSEKKKPDRLQDFATKMATALFEVIDRAEGKLVWNPSWTRTESDSLISPRNAVTGHRYTGGNRLMLSLTLMLMGLNNPNFLTFTQAKKLGGSIRRGEHGIPLLQPRIIEVERQDGDHTPSRQVRDAEEEDGDGTRKVMLWRGYTVFHVSQADGLPEAVMNSPGDTTSDAPSTGTGALIEGLPAMIGVPVISPGEPAYAFYADHIRMPPKPTFHDRDGVPAEALYHAVLLHEWYHATGHPSRENRLVPGSAAKKDGDYAMEELRAEMFSLMAAQALGLPFELADHAAYIEHWRQVVSADPKVVYRSAVEASRMLGAVESVANDETPAIDWWPPAAPTHVSSPNASARRPRPDQCAPGLL